MSHCGTSTSDNHFDYRLIVLKDIQYNIALDSEFFVLEGMSSTFVGMTLVCLIGIELCMFGLTIAVRFPCSSLLGPSVLFGTEWSTSTPNSREWEREYRPCVNLHREKLFQFPWNCVKLKSVSCTSNSPARTCDFRNVDFESSRSSAKSKSWNNPSLHRSAVFPTQQYCQYSLVWWMYAIKRAKRLSKYFVHFFDRTSKFIHRP